MAYNFAPYTGFRPPCSGGPMPGAKAIMAYLMDRFDFTSSLGIYNCRPPSVHGDGRAGDLKIPMAPGPRARPELGNQVVELLGPHGKRLGIQTLIWNRRIYSAASPGGRAYGGVSPHIDHIHWDQTEASGANLTYATLVEVLGPARSTPLPPAPAPAPPGVPYTGYGGRFGGYNLEEFEGHFDSWVRHIQERLNAHSPASRQIEADGRFGPITRDRVVQFQQAKGLQADGVVGPSTWAALG